MSEFIKVTEKGSLSGRTKACILLSELSSDARYNVMKALKLKPKEVRALNEAFKNLPSYEKGNKIHCNMEIDVLEEALDYGFEKGILPKITHKTQKSDRTDVNQDLLDSIRDNPSSVAGLLKNWIDGENNKK